MTREDVAGRRAAAKEYAAVVASPIDPAVEYVPAALARLSACRCPRTVVDDDEDTRSWNLKVLHDAGCVERVDPTAPIRKRLGNGVHPCPRVLPSGLVCGQVRFSWGPAGKPQRRCWGCDHVWTPTRHPVA